MLITGCTNGLNSIFMTWLLIALLPYTLVFLIFWIRLQQESPEVKGAVKKHKPAIKLISVIIPVKNEEGNIQNLLNDLAAQSLDPGYFEVIIIDDGSYDSTLDILRSSNDLLDDIKILRSAGNGKKEAVALGLEHSQGKYIVTTDGDCRVSNNWLKDIYNVIKTVNPDMIIGAVDIINDGSLINRFTQLEFLALQAVTEFYAKKGKPVLCNGANLCFRNPGSDRYRIMVKKNIKSGDDIFIMESFKRQGKIITWIDTIDSMVLTLGPDSLKSFFEQRIRWTSKSTFYTDPALLAISILVFLTNLVISLTLVASFFFPGLWMIYISLFIIKSVPDLFLIALMTRKRNKTGLLPLFLPAQLIYSFYVVVTGTAGIIKGLFSSPQGK